MSGNDQVNIARITAKQAIVVALITSLSGLLGAFIQKHGFDNPAPVSSVVQQDQVRFHGIEFHGSPLARYRVVINVDGVPYSYPGRSVWKEVGPKVPEQAFPLRAGRSDHSVGIEVFMETASGEQIVAISEQDKLLSAGSGITNLRVVKRGGFSRAGNAEATVQVEITPLL